MTDAKHAVFEANRLENLIQALARHGYEVLGPTVRDGAIVLDKIDSADELPVGWTAEVAPAHYHLTWLEEPAIFGYAVGPHSWKKYLHPADLQLWSAERHNGTFRILNDDIRPKRPYAFLGARPCDLAAIAAQDRVLTGDRFRDPVYSARREGAFIIAVQCGRAAPTCFCASMGTGPRAHTGFDLALTELISQTGHRFVVETGSDRGAEILAELETTPASKDDLQAADAETASHQQPRKINTDGIKELLYQNFDHPRWENVAARCLSCANCTMVCPTCFCTTVEDVSDVTGNHAQRWRRWDSCFTLSFSYIHGGSVRASSKSRYRQWMTHKLASWIDQFGTSGCVGCGRCIAWCPVGIDITEEVQAIREGNTHGNP